MATFHFFTDMESFLDQSPGDQFGPISDSQFRVDSKFNLLSSAKAYAICDSQLLVQNSSSGDLNIILRPLIQPTLNIGRISYIIYRGVSISSLTNGSEVADRTFNDVNEKAWSNQEQTDADNQTGPNNPSVDVLGLSYQSSGVGNFLVDDSDSIDSVFFKLDDVQLMSVKAGDHIGDFSGGAVKGGIEIILERLGEIPLMEAVRLNEHIVTISSTIGTTNAEKFAHYHEKEQILNNIDPAAFYGMFQYGEDQLQISSNASMTYSVLDLVQKFQNKNRVYLDIRSEYDHSFNYHYNYGDEIGISLNVSSPPSVLPTENYYTANLSGSTGYGTWPIFIIENQIAVDVTNDNGHGKLLLEIPNINGVLRGIYLAEARSNGKKTSAFSFPQSSITMELSSWVYENTGQFVFASAYILMKTVYDRKTDYQGLFSPGTDAVNHLFPINKLSLTFDTNTEDVAMKVFQDGSIVQHIEYPEHFGDTYAAYVGIAKDSHSYTFFSHPNENIGFLKNSKVQPSFTFITGHYKNQLDFLWLLQELSGQVSFQVREVEYDGFTSRAIQVLNSAFSTTEMKITPNYLNTIQLTHEEYDDLITLITSSTLISDYDIYLSVKSETSVHKDIPGYQLRHAEIVLEGLEYVPGSGNSELQKLIIDTGILIQTMIAKD